MPKRMIDVREGTPLLDIASYARRGPGHRDRLSHEEIEQIRRTVNRTPEVMMKVLSKGSHDLASVRRHFGYIGRYGELEIETDDGEQLKEKGIGEQLLNDWDLDLETHRRQSGLSAANGRAPPKLVHKLMFSMPAGTPPEKVLAAARNFAREEFALKHRYAMTLHTDEPHPHVHMVMKAVSEQGVRLNIRKATLRVWRKEFARRLQELGVPANATERAVRGESRKNMKDGIYRANSRGDSTYTRALVEGVAAELLKGRIRAEAGKETLVATRREVEQGWRSVGDILMRDGQHALAVRVKRFVDQMLAPRTDRELIAATLLARTRESRARD